MYAQDIHTYYNRFSIICNIPIPGCCITWALLCSAKIKKKKKRNSELYRFYMLTYV